MAGRSVVNLLVSLYDGPRSVGWCRTCQLFGGRLLVDGGLSVVGGFVKGPNKARISNDVPGKILKTLLIAIAKNSKIFSINTYKKISSQV